MLLLKENVSKIEMFLGKMCIFGSVTEHTLQETRAFCMKRTVLPGRTKLLPYTVLLNKLIKN